MRRAGVGDREALLLLERGVETAPHWSEAVWDETLRGERGVFLAELDGGLVGFVVGHEVAGVVELESVAVSGAARRGGLGRQLVGALVAWARGLRAVAVELEVRASNGGAIGFYEALGFAVQGRRPRYYSDPVEDAVLMRLELEGVEVSC